MAITLACLAVAEALICTVMEPYGIHNNNGLQSVPHIILEGCIYAEY